MLVLMRVVTFDTWGDNFYINYYGCDKYSGGFYVNSAEELVSLKPGDKLLCASPVARPIVATIFFVSYIFIGSFGILSSIIGIIGDSMEDSITAARAIEHKNQEVELEESADELVHEMRTKKGVMSRSASEALADLRRAFQVRQTDTAFRHTTFVYLISPPSPLSLPFLSPHMYLSAGQEAGYRESGHLSRQRAPGHLVPLLPAGLAPHVEADGVVGLQLRSNRDHLPQRHLRRLRDQPRHRPSHHHQPQRVHTGRVHG